VISLEAGQVCAKRGVKENHKKYVPYLQCITPQLKVFAAVVFGFMTSTTVQQTIYTGRLISPNVNTPAIQYTNKYQDPFDRNTK